MKSWRLLNSGSLPGALNMAIDQALLEMHARGNSPPTLRFYQWCPPAVSLGYFQRHSKIDLSVCNKMNINVVQRPSGGRAVLHQGDLTYAVIAGNHDGIPGEAIAAYRLICEGLLMGFRLLGIKGELRQGKEKSSQRDICFLSGTVGDVLHDNRKFAGSAQYWYRSFLLQHGSIVLEPQTETLFKLWGGTYTYPDHLRALLLSRLTSLSEILGREVNARDVETSIKSGIAQVLGIGLEPGEMSSEEWLLAEQISRENGANAQTG